MFDPGNKLHRQWATRFIESGSWDKCPVRFTVEDDHGNLIGHIQRELILWYAAQENKGKLKSENTPKRTELIGVTGRPGMEFELKV